MEEHVHPGQVGGQGEGRQAVHVLDVDGGAALHGHVPHLHQVKHDEDVADGVPVGVGEVVVGALGEAEPVTLLLLQAGWTKIWMIRCL